MRNVGGWRHHTQKESKKVARGRKSKKERLISKGLCLEKCGKLKRFPPETRLPNQSESNTWPQRVPRRQWAINAEQSPKRQSKKKKEEGRTYIYIHMKCLITPNQSMCIRAKVNKPPHIPASVWGMDDLRNRGAADGPSQTTYIVQSHDQGGITPLGSSSQWWSSVQNEQCHPRPSSGCYRTFTPLLAVERTTHH